MQRATNESIIRSVTSTVLDKIKNKRISELLPMASHLTCQRAQFLGGYNWYQWQDDNVSKIIESLQVIDLEQSPVYYKRMDADTVQIMVEFAERGTSHYVVILVMEDGSKNLADIKYHNTMEIVKREWAHVFQSWSMSLKEAEQVFSIGAVRRNKFAVDTPESTDDGVKEAPDDYWGDWSSDESIPSPKAKREIHEANEENSEDSEDEYYAKWSQDPGTLTPGPEEKEKRILTTLDQQDYPTDNPTAALSELTQMLQKTLPQQSHSSHGRPIVLYPLPKVTMSRILDEPCLSPDTTKREEARSVFTKNLHELIEAAKLLGYEGKDVLEMVQGIVQK